MRHSVLWTSLVLLLVVIATPLGLAAAEPVRGERSGRAMANLMLRGKCVKIGFKDNGTFGMGGIGGADKPGIQFDDTCRGNFMDSRDMVLNSYAFEIFAVRLDSVRYANSNDEYYNQIITDSTLVDKSGVVYRGTKWDHRAVQTSSNSDVSIENDIRFNDTSKFIEITSYVTPKRAVSKLYLLRAVQSDIYYDASDDSHSPKRRGYSTIQGTNIVLNRGVVSMYTIGLFTGKQTGINTGISRQYSYDPFVYFNGRNEEDDSTMGIASRFENVKAGQTVEFPYAYIFGKTTFAAAKMAVDLGLGGGKPGKTPRCNLAPSLCAVKDLGSWR
jgi:hypothetical protein